MVLSGLRVPLALFFAALLGLGTAWYAVSSAAILDAITIGEWAAWPNAGTSSWDPYSHAYMARTGELPLGSGEGLVFVANRDGERKPLEGECGYRVSGQTPPARLWTLELQDETGAKLPPRGGRRAVGSDFVLRNPDDTFVLMIGPSPTPGNWLDSSDGGRFRLVLRLYDTTARSAPFLSALSMPTITKVACP